MRTGLFLLALAVSQVLASVGSRSATTSVADGLDTDTPSANRKPRDAGTISIELADTGPFEQRVRRFLGDFSPGGRLRAELILTNDTDRVIQFDSIETSCGCVDVTPKIGRIVPEDKLSIMVEVPLLPHPPTLQSSIDMKLTLKGESQTRILLEYGYRGLSLLGVRTMFVDLSESETETVIPIPLVVGRGSDFTDLEAKLLPADPRATVTVEDGFAIIKIRWAGPTRSLRGNLRLADNSNRTFDQIPVRVRFLDAPRVHPLVVRFRRCRAEENSDVFANPHGKEGQQKGQATEKRVPLIAYIVVTQADSASLSDDDEHDTAKLIGLKLSPGFKQLSHGDPIISTQIQTEKLSRYKIGVWADAERLSNPTTALKFQPVWSTAVGSEADAIHVVIDGF